MQFEITDKLTILINDVPSSGYINISCVSSNTSVNKFLGMVYSFYDGRTTINVPQHYGDIEDYITSTNLIELCVAIANRERAYAGMYAHRVGGSESSIWECMMHIEDILSRKL